MQLKTSYDVRGAVMGSDIYETRTEALAALQTLIGEYLIESDEVWEQQWAATAVEVSEESIPGLNQKRYWSSKTPSFRLTVMTYSMHSLASTMESASGFASEPIRSRREEMI